MRAIIVPLLLACSLLCVAQQRDPKGGGADRVVSEFKVADVSATKALQELSQSTDLSLGFVADDDTLCRSRVSYSGKDVPVSAVVDSLVAQVPGYRWKRSTDSAVVIIAPISPRPVTEQFLNLIDERFGPVTLNTQTLEATLWSHVWAILHPDQGTAYDILSSTNEPVYRIELSNVSVEQILNRIASVSKKSWFLRPLPSKLALLGGEVPFVLIPSPDRIGAADLCAPVAAAAAPR